MPKPVDSPPSIASRALSCAIYGFIVLLAVIAVGLILLLPERSVAVGLVYGGF